MKTSKILVFALTVLALAGCDKPALSYIGLHDDRAPELIEKADAVISTASAAASAVYVADETLLLIEEIAAELELAAIKYDGEVATAVSSTTAAAAAAAALERYQEGTQDSRVDTALEAAEKAAETVMAAKKVISSLE